MCEAQTEACAGNKKVMHKAHTWLDMAHASCNSIVTLQQHIVNYGWIHSNNMCTYVAVCAISSFFILNVKGTLLLPISKESNNC